MTEENKQNKPKTEGKVKEKVETPKEIVKDIEKSGVPKEVAKKEEKLDEKAMKDMEKKKEEKTEEKPKKHPNKKKTEAVVNAYDIPISTKHSAAISMFIKRKKINQAIKELEDVLAFKRPIPMKGEIPHRRGKGIMSGRFPKKATENFIKLLKSLSANAVYNGLEDPIIVEAVANIGERPYGRFGAVRKKRTHIKIVAKNKQIVNKK